MNTNALATIASLSDDALLTRLEELAAGARFATAELIAHLAELARRKAHRQDGEGSLFKHCTQVLKLSEAAACNRIAAAYASLRFPVILELLAEGSVNLTTVRLLAPHLTIDNHAAVLAEARGRTKEGVLEIRARLAPQADVRPSVRRLPDAPPPVAPAPRHALEPVLQARAATDGPGARSTPREAARPAVVPLAPERYGVHMTVDRETRDDLRRVQDLLRREVPDGDPGQIFARALKLLLRDAERKAFAATEQPGRPRILIPRTRTIPAHVRRAVWIRDGGRCAFVGRRGRCSECSFLEFHHIVPYERGGEPTVENIALRCRAHNQYEAELVYGREAIQRRRKRTRPEPGESVPEQISSVMKSGEARAKMTT